MLLSQFAKSFTSADPATKPFYYYQIYDEYFQKNKFVPTSILEIGVFNGESTKVFSRCFPEAKIVALDLELKEIDFSDYPNVKYVQANQTDKNRLEELAGTEFPEGIDMILDDASHIGSFSAITMRILFPYLKSNGTYVIEDWGTGYWDSWVDGSRFQEYPLNFHDGNVPKRLPSHDYGMVGFVKSLVDLTHESAIRAGLHDTPKHVSRLKSVEFFEGLCFARKK